MRIIISIGLLSCLWGCTDPEVFTLQPIPPQRATVGQELQLELTLTDLGGIVPRFILSSPTIPDLMTRVNPPRFSVFGSGNAFMRWVPIGMDTGTHEMTLVASGDAHSTSETFQIVITAGNAAPIFLRPLGAGLTLDLSRERCFEFDVEVQDTDTVAGTIQLQPPVMDGYELVRTGDWSASFSWCPTQGQITGRSRYELNLLADDSDGHQTTKNFNLILRDAIGDNCEGRAPFVEHMPPTVAYRNLELDLTVRVTDDLGIASEPIIYYRADQGQSDRNLESFTSMPMTLRSGNELDGLYQASISTSFLDPSDQGIQYFIEVQDNDDLAGNCDHRSTYPADDLENLAVETRPVSPTIEECGPCSVDGECVSGFCAELSGGNVCLEPCSALGQTACQTNPKGWCCGNVLWRCVEGRQISENCNGPCGWNNIVGEYDCQPTHPSDPSGQFPNQCAAGNNCSPNFECSSEPMTGQNGRLEFACAPLGGSCFSTCNDDLFEPNDTLASATPLNLPVSGLDDLKLCGQANVTTYDRFSVYLETSGLLSVDAYFRHDDGDLDLSLIDAEEQFLGLGYSTTDNESVSQCVQNGTYTLNVFTFGPASDIPYSLDVRFTQQSCCAPDLYEPNNTIDTAQLVYDGTVTELLSICQDDTDVYLIDLIEGQELTVDLVFDQRESDQDLDVFIHDINNVRLTPCCQLDNGQSITADEQLIFSAPSSGRFAIVVEGFRGAQNDYLMGISVE